ncbi:hypothetical protein N7492_004109 [Penicillium capsulatum]|uniref:Zn(2)-C6 fungal-type domain-containing protein n=1 Tax=Penicillium capsulatum TaxID=69766 RepID=A0A9W9IKV7_9EURO|nr:hypothetical protein N7492_004109 [Penicillium capsulatum]
MGRSESIHDTSPVEIKRPRACEPCRQLKVRCDPDPEHPDGSCKRCAKARRACVVTAPTRKRQKKTDSRVTELERKIDALTATLQASQNKSQGLSQSSPPSSAYLRRDEPQASTRRWLPEDPNVAGTKRNHDGLLVSQHPRPERLSAEQVHRTVPSRQWRGPYAGKTEPAKPDARKHFADIIDRGIVDVQSAAAAFNRYVTDMADEMPFVVFPPGTTMNDVRREKPVLFLCIIAVSIGPFNKDIQMPLLTEFYQMVADRVVVKGEKSLELVQALLVSAIWYIMPDNMEEMKFYQLIHMAIVVAMDMGLNRRSMGDLKPLARIREIIAKKPQVSAKALDGPEARRTWVGCYFLGIQVATALRRMQLVKWQPYMDECLQILENHPDALPSDRRLIWWAKLAYIMEQAGVQLSAEDPYSMISFADTPLANTKYAVDLFVHESAMGVDCSEGNSPDSLGKDHLPTSAIAPLIDALTTCIRAIHQAIDSITTVSPERLTCMPTLALARTTYPVVSLIKIYSLLTASDTRIGQVIDMQTLKVEYYLDRVINQYQTAAAMGGGRVAAKFCNIVMMLRTWFLKKKENGPELREMFGAEMRSDTPVDHQPAVAKQGTTPLHLLSEVAMGDPANGSSPTGNISHRPRPGHENSHSPATTSSFNYGSTGHPGRLNSIASAHSEPPATAWSTPSPLTQPVPVTHGHNPETRAYYQSYAPTNPSQPYVGPQPSISAPPGGASADAYSSMPNMGMPGSQPMDMGGEMGMEGNFGPENLFVLGTMMEDGLLGFPPLTFDGNFQF